MNGRDFEDKAKNSAGTVRLIVTVFIILNIFSTIWLVNRWYIDDEFAIAWGIISIMSLLLFQHMWESVYQMLRHIAKLTRDGHKIAYALEVEEVEKERESQQGQPVWEVQKTDDDYLFEMAQFKARNEHE